jgi:hypothetical protein
LSQQPLIIQLYAGTRPDGEPVYEKVAVIAAAEAESAQDAGVSVGGSYQLLHSPGFVRGLARGDSFTLISSKAGSFEVTQRSGNLAVRVYSKMPSQSLDAALTPQVNQLDGRRDVMSENLLVYSIGVTAGFEAIEAVFDQALSGSADASWNYGNVYDEHTGQALNWWLRKPAPAS